MVSQRVRLRKQKLALRKQFERGKLTSRQFFKQNRAIQRQIKSSQARSVLKAERAGVELPVGEVRMAREIVQPELREQRITAERAAAQPPKPGEPITVTQAGKTFKGQVTPQGRILATRTVPKEEQRQRQTEQARQQLRPVGAEPEPTRAVTIAQQTRIRQAVPVATQGIPLTTEVQFEKTPSKIAEEREERLRETATPLEKRLTKRAETRQSVLMGTQKVIERFGIQPGPSDVLDIGITTIPTVGGVGKAVARLPLEIPAGLFLAGQGISTEFDIRTSVKAQPEFREPARLERERARAQVKEELPKGFDPRTPEGVVNIALVAGGVRGLAKGLRTGVTQRKTGFRRVKAEKSFLQLEKSIQGEKPFQIIEEVIFEPGKPGTRGKLTEPFSQIDLFGRRVSPEVVKKSLRAPEIEQGLLFEKITPEGRVRIKAGKPSVLDPRGQRTLLPTEIVAIEPTGIRRPVKVINGDPFVQFRDVRKPGVRFLEFVPEKGTRLRTVSPRPLVQPGFDTQFSIFETARQTQLRRFAPELRPADAAISIRTLSIEISPLVRRPTPALRGKLPKAPKKPLKGVETVSFKQEAVFQDLFGPSIERTTFLEITPKPTPAISKVAPTTISRLGTIPTEIFGIRSIEKRRQIRKQKTSQLLDQRLEVEQAFIFGFAQDVNPLTGQIISPRQKPKIKQRQRVGQRQLLDTLTVQTIFPVTPFAPSPPLPVQIFGPPEPPKPPRKVPPPPLGLPSFKKPRTGRTPPPEFDPLEIEQSFVPSATSLAFGLFGEQREKGIFSGLAQRRIPKRLKGRLSVLA